MIPATPASLPFVEAIHRDPDDLTAQADYLKWLIDSYGRPMGDAFREVALCAKHAREMAQVQLAHDFIITSDRQAARDLRGRIQNMVGLYPSSDTRLEIVVIPGPQAPKAGTLTVTVGAHWICERM